MSRDLLNRESVCASFTEPRQKRVAERVYHAVIRKLQIAPQLLVDVVKRSSKGYWELQLSPDKSAMEGTWHGDDPRESGRLQFRKVK